MSIIRTQHIKIEIFLIGMKHIFVITYHRVTNSDKMPYGWVSGKHVNKRNTVSSLPSHFKTVIFFTPLFTIPTSLITLIKMK